MDTLILYLRLVHSVDYYNNAEYRNEDEMPNRCGIIHVRGEPPSNPIMPFEMHDYLKKFAEKVDALIQDRNVSNTRMSLEVLEYDTPSRDIVPVFETK